MKKLFNLIMAIILVSLCMGCGKNDSAEEVMSVESEAEEQSETEEQIEHKAFDDIDFGPFRGVIMFDLDDYYNSTPVYEHQFDYEYNSRLAKDLLFINFTDDQSEYAGAAEIIELGYQGDTILGYQRYFYKADIKDISVFKNYIEKLCNRNEIDMSNWAAGDEVYIDIDYDLDVKEHKINLFFYISNESVRVVQQDNINEALDDNPIQNSDDVNSDSVGDWQTNSADWSQEITEEIGCGVFKAKIPKDWLDRYSWDVSPSDEGIEICDPSLNGCIVCNIHLVYGSLDSIIAPFLLVGEVQGEYVSGAYLVIEDCLEQFEMEELEFIRDNISLNDGYEFSSGY